MPRKVNLFNSYSQTCVFIFYHIKQGCPEWHVASARNKLTPPSEDSLKNTCIPPRIAVSLQVKRIHNEVIAS